MLVVPNWTFMIMTRIEFVGWYFLTIMHVADAMANVPSECDRYVTRSCYQRDIYYVMRSVDA